MNSKAHFRIGYCLNATGKYNEAVDHLKKAVEAEPVYTAAYTELGYSYFKLDKDTDALTQFDKTISLNPKNANARYYSCLVFIKQKNKTKAQKIVDELKALSPNQASVLQEKLNAL